VEVSAVTVTEALELAQSQGVEVTLVAAAQYREEAWRRRCFRFEDELVASSEPANARLTAETRSQNPAERYFVARHSRPGVSSQTAPRADARHVAN
jgi:hypothetical protein